MKTKISVYWPVAVVLTLAAMAAMQGYGEHRPPGSHAPLAAAQVSAELARAVSYGLVGTQPVRASSSVSAVRGTESSQAL